MEQCTLIFPRAHQNKKHGPVEGLTGAAVHKFGGNCKGEIQYHDL